jgi:hypothetical protein
MSRKRVRDVAEYKRAPRPRREEKSSIPLHIAPFYEIKYIPFRLANVEIGEADPNQIRPLAEMVRRRVMAIERIPAIRGQSFNLLIKVHTYLHETDMNQWLTIDLGSYNRFSEETSVDELIDLIWQRLLELAEEYGRLITFLMVSIIIVMLGGGVVGGCDKRARGGVFMEQGINLQSFKSKDNECGIRILIHVFKKNKSRMNAKLFNKYCRSIKGIRKACDDPPALKSPWTVVQLNQVCTKLNVNLIVYPLANITGDPLFGVESGKGLLTIRMVYCPPGSKYSDNGCGHYLYMTDQLVRCELCKKQRIPKRLHKCVLTCEHCGETYTVSNVTHRCIRQVRAEEKDNYERSTTVLRQEVEDILAGKVDDEKTLFTWRQRVDRGLSTALLGDAGTGKTYQMKKLIRDKISSGEWKPSQIQVLCSEACGTQAYADLEGVERSTIHSFLKLYINCDYKKHARTLDTDKRHKANKLRIMRKSVIVIDEIGNLSVDLASKLSYILSHLHTSNIPFGNAQLLITGDFNQRPPIVQDELQPPLFMTQFWQSLNVKASKLKKQHRLNVTSSDDLLLLKAQLLVARGILDSETRNALCDLTVKPDPSVYENDPDVTYLVNLNADVFSIGKRKIFQFLPHDSIVEYHAKTSDGSIATKAKPNVLFDPILYAAVDAPMMFTNNRYASQGATNGTMGRVVSLEEQTLTVRLDYDPRITICVERMKLTGGAIQFPIRLAYARTTSKSQGATLNKVCFFPWDNSKAVANTYVGISRVRSAKDLFMSEWLLPKHIVVSPLANKYMEICDLGPSQIRKQLEVLHSKCPLPYAYNNTPHAIQILSTDKSVHKGEKQLWKRDMLRPKYPQHIWKNVLTFDFETAPDDRGIETPYSVYARFWKTPNDYIEFYHGLDDEGNLQPDCQGHFTRWMMEELVKPICDEWVASNYKNKASIKLIAFNGSGFDFGFVANELLARCEYDGITFKPTALASSRLMQSEITFTDNGRDLKVVQLWDPYLMCGLSLDKAHAAFCSEKHKKVKKDVFPHKYLKRVGAERGFETRGPIELNIKKDFFENMWSVVAAKIKRGELERGSEEGTVMFDLRKQHDTYLKLDVILMENVYEALCDIVFQFIPGENLLPTSFPTLASFAYYASTRLLPPEAIESIDKKGMRRTKLHRVSMRLSRIIREGVFGGRTLNRCLKFISSQYDDIVAQEKVYGPGLKRYLAAKKAVESCISAQKRLVPKADESLVDAYANDLCDVFGKKGDRKLMSCDELDTVVEDYIRIEVETRDDRLAGKACYDSLDDALFYLDVNGMYHAIMQEELFPYGVHQELTATQDCESLLRFFLEDKTDQSPMFLMRLDLFPNIHDVESSIPHRGEAGRLMWDNTPKIQQVYTSVHIRLAMDRGYRIANPTWAIVWGKQDQTTGEWSGDKTRLFHDFMKKCEAGRLLGGGFKTFYKGTANRNFGAWTKRDFDEEYHIFSSVGGVFENVDELLMHYRDGSKSCTYHESYVKPNGDAVVVTKWTSAISEEEVLGKRGPWIGAFVLAYAHRMIDDGVENSIGEHRRNGDYTRQIYNGDTDSIFLHARDVDVKRMGIHLKTLGKLSDDLDKYYPTPKTDEYGDIVSDSKGRPPFAKIVQMCCPAKKMYAMKFLTPEGLLKTSNPKSKGIGKGQKLNLSSGFEWSAFKEKYASGLKSADVDVKRQARNNLHCAVREHGGDFTDALTFDLLMASVEKSSEFEGIVGSTQSWKSYGLNLPQHALAANVEFFQKCNTVLSREILTGGAKFPPERKRWPRCENGKAVDNKTPTTIWSVPNAWIPKGGSCACYNCK